MTRIIMNGCNGHMGRVITELVESDADAQIVAGVDIVAPPMAPYPVYSSVADVKEEADVIIDFSTPKILTKLIEEAQKRNIALVLCTTGYTKEQIAEIDEASKTTAIVRSANMSLGVNVLLRLVQEAAKKLAAEGFDIEIVEKHHHFKKDAPSGTALEMGKIISEIQSERGLSRRDGRSGMVGAREANEIGYHAIRCGDVVGEHTAIFGFAGERIEISHKSGSRSVLAEGALSAVRFLIAKKAGRYSMRDVITEEKG